MTITGMTRFVQQNYKVQNSHLTHKLPNGSLPPKEHVNPYCPEGMDITGRTDFRRIVPVDEGVANKIKSLVFESMEKNCGMSDGEIESEIIRNYVMSLPPEERAAAGWTLNQVNTPARPVAEIRPPSPSMAAEIGFHTRGAIRPAAAIAIITAIATNRFPP